MKRLVTAVLAAAALATPAHAQEIPIDQMSTPQALDFLRGLMIAQGRVVYRGDYSNVATGSTWSQEFTTEYTDIKIYPDSCNISFHYVSKWGTEVKSDIPTAGIPFAQVAAVTHGSEASKRNAEMAREGRVDDRVTITPNVWSVQLFRDDGHSNQLQFYSERMAEQAAQTSARLRALCRH